MNIAAKHCQAIFRGGRPQQEIAIKQSCFSSSLLLPLKTTNVMSRVCLHYLVIVFSETIRLSKSHTPIIIITMLPV